jgi:hypothetical protein
LIYAAFVISPLGKGKLTLFNVELIILLFRDHYEVLGVSKSATTQEIKQAFYELSKKVSANHAYALIFFFFSIIQMLSDQIQNALSRSKTPMMCSETRKSDELTMRVMIFLKSLGVSTAFGGHTRTIKEVSTNSLNLLK